MRHVLELGALGAVRAGSCAPCTGGREGRAACAVGAVMCCVLLVNGMCVTYVMEAGGCTLCARDAGGYVPCAALYAGGRGRRALFAGGAGGTGRAGGYAPYAALHTVGYGGWGSICWRC